MNLKNKKKLLLVAGTHGNEKLGMEIVDELRKDPIGSEFDYLIGNPKAFNKNERFIQADLNRVYPGDRKSDFYEERLAFQNMRIASGYEYIIDIHEANGIKDSFIIVPLKKISPKKKTMIERIVLDKVILWPSTSGRVTGPMSQFLDNCIELEFGTKGVERKQAVKKAAKIISNFIKTAKPRDFVGKNRKYFLVYGEIFSSEYSARLFLKDFVKARLSKESFYPLFVNQYGNGILCYKAKLIKKYESKQ